MSKLSKRVPLIEYCQDHHCCPVCIAPEMKIPEQYEYLLCEKHKTKKTIKYKIDYRSEKTRKEMICESEEKMWWCFADAICNAFNNVRAIIDGKVVKEDPEHGWQTDCPICKFARDFMGKWYVQHGTYHYKTKVVK